MVQEEVDFKDFLKSVEERTGLKFKPEPGINWALDDTKVVGIGLEGVPAPPKTRPKLNLEDCKEIELTDFTPEVVTYGAKGSTSISFYLIYDYKKPASILGVKTSKVGYNAVWLHALANLFKQTYGEVHLYIHKEIPQPLLLRGKSLGEEYGGLEAYIAPRIPELPRPE